MTEAEIRDLAGAVLGDIAPEADLANLPDDAVLRDELDLDSMDFLNFVAGLHERTGIDIPEADYPQLATMAGVIAYLRADGHRKAG